MTSIDFLYHHVNLTEVSAIADALKVNTKLTSIGLGACDIGAEGARLIADALKVNKTLTSISLYNSRIDNEAARAVADALKVNTGLTSIDLRKNGFGSEGAMAIADALRVNKSLTSINLRDNHIGQEGASAIMDALKVNKTLNSIDADANGCTALINAASSERDHTSLVTLLLNGGAAVNKAAVDGRSALHFAADRGHTTTLALLLAHGADNNSRTQAGATALMLAAGGGHDEAISLLLDGGADILPKDANGNSAHALLTTWARHSSVAAPTAASREPTLAPALAQLLLRLKPRPICPKEDARAFVKSLGISGCYFDAKYDRCYCEVCYPPLYRSIIRDADGPDEYVIPRGWVRFGLGLSRRAYDPELAIFKKWSVSFHGVKSPLVLKSILEHGALLKPGDTLLTSPTIRYAGLKFYAEPQAWQSNTMRASIVLQCRQKPSSFREQGETMGFRRSAPQHLATHCPHTKHEAIERLSEVPSGTIAYGLLVRTWRKGQDPEAAAYRSPVDGSTWWAVEDTAP